MQENVNPSGLHPDWALTQHMQKTDWSLSDNSGCPQTFHEKYKIIFSSYTLIKRMLTHFTKHILTLYTIHASSTRFIPVYSQGKRKNSDSNPYSGVELRPWTFQWDLTLHLLIWTVPHINRSLHYWKSSLTKLAPVCFKKNYQSVIWTFCSDIKLHTCVSSLYLAHEEWLPSFISGNARFIPVHSQGKRKKAHRLS